MDVRSIRKTREALTAPSCFLLFDGLRIEFATTAATTAAATPSITPSSVTSPLPASAAPFPLAADGAADAATRSVAPPEEQGSPTMPTRSPVKPEHHGNGKGAPASATSDDQVANGGGRGSGLTPPPFSSSVETVRVLSVEVADTVKSAC